MDIIHDNYNFEIKNHKINIEIHYNKNIKKTDRAKLIVWVWCFYYNNKKQYTCLYDTQNKKLQYLFTKKRLTEKQQKQVINKIEDILKKQHKI